MNFIFALWKYLLVISPFLLIGIIIIGFIHTCISQEHIKKLPNKTKSLLRTIILHAFFPLYSSNLFPNIFPFKKNFQNDEISSSLMPTTPNNRIDTLMLTYSLLDFPMAFFRLLCTFIQAIGIEIVQIYFNKKIKTFNNPIILKSKVHLSLKNKTKKALNFAFSDLINDLAKWLVIGITIGAAIEATIPTDFLSNLNTLWGRPIILGLGTALYLCTPVNTPIAAALVAKGISPGSALMFLLIGPATNLPHLRSLKAKLGLKNFKIHLMAVIFSSLLFSYLIDWIYLAFDFNTIFPMSQKGETVGNWFQNLCTIPVMFLLIKGIISREKK